MIRNGAGVLILIFSLIVLTFSISLVVFPHGYQTKGLESHGLENPTSSSDNKLIAQEIPVSRGKPTAPVSIECDVPNNLQAGDAATTIISFVAQSSMEQLQVSVAAYEGLDVLSSNQKFIFQNLEKGAEREIEVTIRLAAEIGYLSVFATTTTSQDTRTKATAIRFGTVGAVTKQRLKSQMLQKTPQGENLILLPGERRP